MLINQRNEEQDYGLEIRLKYGKHFALVVRNAKSLIRKTELLIVNCWFLPVSDMGKLLEIDDSCGVWES